MLALVAGVSLCALIVACGGGAGGTTTGVPNVPSPVDDGRKTALVGEDGGLELIILDEMTADAVQLIEVVRTGEIVVPEGFTAAGGAVTTSPPGISFEFPSQLGIPVDPALIPGGLTLNDLVIFERPVDGGPIRLLPVIDVDEATNQVFAAITALSTFQVAAPQSAFRIDPAENLLQQVGITFGQQLTYRSAMGAVTFSLAAVEQVSGEDAGGTGGTGDIEPNEDGNYVIAPGVVLTPQGRIQGTPQVGGSWTFTIAAIDSKPVTPNLAAISMSLTVMSKTRVAIPGFPISDTVWAYASNGDAIVVTNSAGSMNVHRIPADGGATVSSAALQVAAINPSIALHPSGEAVVVAYERVVTMTLDFGLSQLTQVLRADATGLVSGLGFDLNGNGTADVTVDFQAAETGFTGTDAELNALAAALNAALTAASLPVDVVANVGGSGIRFVDQGTGFFVGGPTGQVQSPRLMQGGGAIAAMPGSLNTAPQASFRRIYAVEIGADMTISQGPFRVDSDPVYDAEEPDTTATMFSRQAIRPVVSFAVSPTATTVAANDPYIVAYEVIRNVTSTGGLRADVYTAWRSFGASARTLPTRIDATTSHGDSSGHRLAIAATESAATVLWVERGGEPESGTGTGSAAATPGDLAAVELTIPPVPTGDLEVQSGIPEPEFVNEADETSAGHPTVTVTAEGEIWVVWSERDDTPLNPVEEPGTGTTAATAGRGSQSSGILTRRDLSLRAGRLTGGTVADPFQVDIVNNSSSAYSTAITISADGEIAVFWVEAPHDGTPKGYLRRFLEAGVPLELPLYVAFPIETIIHYDAEGRLGLVSRAGGDLHVMDFTPEPLVVSPAPASRGR